MKQFTKYQIVIEFYEAYDSFIVTAHYPPSEDKRVENRAKARSEYIEMCQDITDMYDLTTAQANYYKELAIQLWHELNTI